MAEPVEVTADYFQRWMVGKQEQATDAVICSPVSLHPLLASRHEQSDLSTSDFRGPERLAGADLGLIFPFYPRIICRLAGRKVSLRRILLRVGVAFLRTSSKEEAREGVPEEGLAVYAYIVATRSHSEAPIW